jgi:hypothetical protein
MNILELQVLAAVSRIPDEMPAEPAPASSGSRTAAVAVPRIEHRPATKPSP